MGLLEMAAIFGVEPGIKRPRNDHDHQETTTGEPYDSGPPRERFTETARIGMRQSKLLKTNQSPQSIVLYKVVTRNQLT